MNNKINILLIEDNPADATLVDIYLKEAFHGNYTLIIVKSLSEIPAKETFNVIITDIALPDSQGIDTFTKVYSLNPNAPIIVLTGFGDEAFGIYAVKEGAADFLNKKELNSDMLRRSIIYSIERYKLREYMIAYTLKLEASEKQLAAAQHYAKMGNWEWDLVNNTVEWSDELYRIYGYEPRQVKVSYKWLLKRIHPQDLELVKQNVEERFQNLKPFDYYFRIILDDQSIKTIHGIGEVFADDKGKVIRMSGVDHDVTDSLRREEFKNLAMATTQSYNSVVIADKSGCIEWVNEGFQKLTGYTFEDIKYTFADNLNPGNTTGLNPVSEYYQKLMQTKQPVTYETKNYTKSGKGYWVLTTLSPILDSEGNIEKIVAIDSDISKRKQIEQELIIANKIADHSLMKGNKALNELIIAKNNAELATKKAEESAKLKEAFLANMSHEIRTPMNAIMGFSDMLSQRDLGKEEREFVTIIRSAGESLLTIINDILDISKIEAGQMSFEENNFSINDTFKSLNGLLMPKAKEKNLELIFTCDDDIPNVLLGDHTRFTQIIINLASNAIKFTQKGSVHVHAKTLKNENEIVLIGFTVKDTGIGIHKDKLENIFERFRQAESHTTRKYGGTGLGLSIAKQLVELQGGSISVKSELYEGSEFSFCIPYKKTSQIQVITEVIQKKVNMEDLRKLKILFVEDNPLNVLLVKSLFLENNLKLQIAENGSVCISKLGESYFDIILMDMEMPVMNGYEATTIIRTELKSNIPIIAMTANAMAGERERCLNLGMNEYISKPINAVLLFEKIYELTNKINTMIPSESEKNDVQKEPVRENVCNFNYLIEMTGSNNIMIKEIMDVFLRQAPEELQSINDAVIKTDYATIKSVAHTMKSTVSIMGISILTPVLQEMQDLGASAAGIEKIKELNIKLNLICTQAIEEVEGEKHKYV